MGQEVQCRATYHGRTGDGTAHLDTDCVRFKGDWSFKVPFADLREASASGGKLTLRSKSGDAVLHLGPAAQQWFTKIRYPKPVIDKLGVKEGQRIAVLGVDDDNFAKQVRARTGDVSFGRQRKECDLVFFGAETVAGLAKLARLKASIRRDGAIWVIWPKGRKALREDDVRAAAIDAGLVDVKVVSFSETHSALKLVVPVSRRGEKVRT